ncbi:hypothetical protein ACFSQ7_43320 [Paenibacillus rhizoplanae]
MDKRILIRRFLRNMLEQVDKQHLLWNVSPISAEKRLFKCLFIHLLSQQRSIVHQQVEEIQLFSTPKFYIKYGYAAPSGMT